MHSLQIKLVMLVFTWILVLSVVLVFGESQVIKGFPRLVVVLHTTHKCHRCHTAVTSHNGSNWHATSLYSFVAHLSKPSQLGQTLVTSIHPAIPSRAMPNPEETEGEGARASNIQLVIKYPSFSWEGNQYESFKTFKSRTTILMEGSTERFKSLTKLQLY